MTPSTLIELSIIVFCVPVTFTSAASEATESKATLIHNNVKTKISEDQPAGGLLANKSYVSLSTLAK